MSWLTAPRWQMIWGCFRSFALLRIRVLPDLMMDTHRCIAIGRNCLPFRITRVHFRLFGSLCCSCAFVIFLCYIGWLLLVCFCAFLVYILSSAIVFFITPFGQWQSHRKNQIARERIFVRNSYPSPCGWMHRWEVVLLYNFIGEGILKYHYINI